MHLEGGRAAISEPLPQRVPARGGNKVFGQRICTTAHYTASSTFCTASSLRSFLFFIRLTSCIGATCRCFLFGKNAQFLGSGTLAGSCTTHCMLWGLLTSLCCVFTGGLVLAVPGSAVACYACGYRQALRTKYNLPEAPCGDLTTHLFCHLCAICQEYREIRERTDSSTSSAPNVTPPPVQTMDEP